MSAKETEAQVKINRLLEETKNGFADFLLLDEKGFPFVVLEAKAEKINPLSAKEQVLVDGNRELVTCFEKKIQQTIARVWGES